MFVPNENLMQGVGFSGVNPEKKQFNNFKKIVYRLDVELFKVKKKTNSTIKRFNNFLTYCQSILHPLSSIFQHLISLKWQVRKNFMLC